jgi:GT2 family glycosyltransferase
MTAARPLRSIRKRLRRRAVQAELVLRAAWDRDVHPGFSRYVRRWRRRGQTPEVSVVLVTYNRLRMLRECLESLVSTIGDVDAEVVVWDNASTDGTGEYLDEMASRHPVLRIHHSRENIGLNAFGDGVKLTRGFYIVELDDDVVKLPEHWLSEILRAFKAVPRAGCLAANVVQDDMTNGAKPPAENYTPREYPGGVVIEEGPPGGWCTMTSLEVLGLVGNFRSKRGRIFALVDGDFALRCVRRGLVIGIVRDVVVYHAVGAVLNQLYGHLDTYEKKYSQDERFAPQREEIARLRAAGALDTEDRRP